MSAEEIPSLDNKRIKITERDMSKGYRSTGVLLDDEMKQRNGR